MTRNDNDTSLSAPNQRKIVVTYYTYIIYISTQPGSKQLAVQNAKVAHLFHGKTELVQGSLVKRAVGPTWPFGTLLDLCTSRVDVHFSICASEHAAEGQGIG